MFNTLWDLTKDIANIVTILSFVVEFTPIKLNPLSYMFTKFGKAINKDLEAEIKNLENDVIVLGNTLQKTEASLVEKIESNDRKQTERYIKQLRGNILNFSNSCMKGELHTKNEFENIIEAHMEYVELIDSLGLTNGVVELEFRFITEEYNKHIRENSFYGSD